MATTGSILIKFDASWRLSEAASDAFVETYSQAFLNHFTSLLRSVGEQQILDKLRNSAQLVLDWDTELIQNVEELSRLKNSKPAVGSQTPWMGYTLWDVLGESPDITQWTDDEHENARMALAEVQYSHDFALQLDKGVFFMQSVQPEDVLNFRDYDFNVVVDFTTRTVHAEENNFSFDQLLVVTPDLVAPSEKSA